MPALTARLFGGFSFVVDGLIEAAPSTAKARAMAAYLLLARPHPVSRDRLADAFWPDSDGDRSRNSVATALWSIRRALRSLGLEPDAYLAADAATIAWRGDVQCDVTRFEAALRDDPADAVETYRGAFLEGIADEWTVRERERLDALYESALARSLDEPPARGSVNRGELERRARLLVERNPYSDAAWTTLIDQYVAAGATASARAAFRRALAACDDAGLESAPLRARFPSLATASPQPDRLPFVGRDREIDRVLGALRDPDAPGGVVIIGQAGIGKSELLSRVAASLEAAGVPIARIAPHRGQFSLDALEALAGEVTGIGAEALLGAGATTRAQAIADALVGQTDRTYVIDDVHRADGDVREIVLALIGTSRTVAAMRPEGLAAIHAHGGCVPGTIVELRALDRESVLDGLRGTALAPAERERVYVLSGGYPLVLDALLRSPAARNATIHVPDAARIVLERRLDERGAMPARAASVLALEPGLSAEEVARVLGVPSEAVLDAFDDLFALGIVVDDAAGPAFCHDLFAEVAARRLSPVRRRALHERIADELGPDADPARYAHHVARARRPLEAARAYLRAAEFRFSRGAFHDARELIAAGLNAVGTLDGDVAAELRILLRTELARALADAGLQNDGVAAIERAAAEARAVRRDDLLLRALLIKNRLGIEMRSVRGAECDEVDVNETLALAEKLPPGLASVQALGIAARGMMNRSLATADRYASSALAIARQLDEPRALAEALQASTAIALLQWDIERAIDQSRELIDTARRIGTVRASRATGLHAVALLFAERCDQAETFGRAALALAAEPMPDDDLLRISRWRLEMTALEVLTFTELRRRRYADAAEWGRRRCALPLESLGDRCEADAILALVLLAADRPSRADVDEAAAAIAAYDDTSAIGRLYILRVAEALVAEARGDANARRATEAAWESCRNLPSEEHVTLDYWLDPLGRTARRLGAERIARDVFDLADEVARRRRNGSGRYRFGEIRLAT